MVQEETIVSTSRYAAELKLISEYETYYEIKYFATDIFFRKKIMAYFLSTQTIKNLKITIKAEN